MSLRGHPWPLFHPNINTKHQEPTTKNRFQRGAILATNPVTSISTVDKLKSVLKTVTDAALFVEQIIGEFAGPAGTGGLDAAGVERLTQAFANLASIAIQAAHDAAGREITPESVQALMPVSTPLTPPVG
jgi:hypothetical protein